MKTLLKGGTIVSGQGSIQMDVLLEDGLIRQVGEDLQCEDTCVVDVCNKLLFPGFIDAHTHFDLHVAGTITADDFSTGTKAAIVGGTTTIIDFATQYKGETLQEALSNWHQKADGKASCDYSFHMAISDWNPNVSQELELLIQEGISSFKLYLTYDDMKVEDKELYQILKRLKEVGGIAGIHCENSGLIAALTEEQKSDAQTIHQVSSHYLSRPSAAEAEAIDRVLRIAGIVDTPVIIVHLSTKEGYEVIKAARKRGQKVLVETCPQYLLLEDSVYEAEGLEGAKYVIAPPLRKREDRECLWKALGENTIQTVATDHCSFTLAQKALGTQDFTKIPGGLGLVEFRGNLLYEYGVRRGKITLWQLCTLLAENPAKIYGLYPRKGIIQEGSDADIVVFNPLGEKHITAKEQMAHTDYTPFEGIKVKGSIEKVYLRGELVISEGNILQESLGTFQKRESPLPNLYSQSSFHNL